MAAPIAPPVRMSAEEFYARHAADDLARKYELVDGEVRHVSPTNLRHGMVCANVLRHLDRYVSEHRLGACATEAAGYQLRVPGRAGDTVRASDVSFISAARLRRVASAPRGFARGGPDRAVEVRSPDDATQEVLARRDDLFADGTRLFWDVDPRRRTVAVRAPGVGARVLGVNDTLDGGDVVPGFSVPAAELFYGLDELDP